MVHVNCLLEKTNTIAAGIYIICVYQITTYSCYISCDKLCVCRSAGTLCPSQVCGTHVGVSVYMMKGKFDYHLKWPFKGEITVGWERVKYDGERE